MTSYDNLIAEGKIIGKAEGIAEGIAEGKAKIKYEIVKKAILKGYPVEEIADLVGISGQEVKKIIKEIESKKK